jgi:diaminohydroxyphosphoribosylaminopyrimidine deaminase / 5-amino-6-(5-phosphoribosylamino)uracil reductase
MPPPMVSGMGISARAGFDAHMMKIALRLAERGLGRTAPNPSVGAVIADEAAGEVIARGWTAPGGRPHAETEVLARAGVRAHGATMYVTLEPCSHYGATPPCAEAVIAAGIARVVCAIEDPDPRVAGRGLAKLRAAGIAVERGVMAEAAHWMAAGHILRVTERRPLAQLKIALRPDGSVPRGAGGKPTWATSEAARAQGQLMRARADAVLVGRRTVLDDDPLLTCRLPGLAARSPVRVVLARDLAGLQASRLVRSAREHPVWLFCGERADASALESAGVRVFRAPEIGAELWLPSVMESLVAQGLTRLLVEGGPATWGAFARAGLVDEVVVFHARPEGARALAPAAVQQTLDRYVAAGSLEFFEHRTVGSDDMMAFRRHWRTLGAREMSTRTG